MNSRLLPDAEQELLAAAQGYYDVQPDLADRFLNAVTDARIDVENHPMRFPAPVGVRTGRTIRRRLLTGFPYALVYNVRETEILILAVAHASRKPGYCRTRS